MVFPRFDRNEGKLTNILNHIIKASGFIHNLLQNFVLCLFRSFTFCILFAEPFGEFQPGDLGHSFFYF